MGTMEIAMTAQRVMPGGPADDAFLQNTAQPRHHRFDLNHVTPQLVRVRFTAPCVHRWTPPALPDC